MNSFRFFYWLLFTACAMFVSCRKMEVKKNEAPAAAVYASKTVQRDSSTIQKWHPGHYIYLLNVYSVPSSGPGLYDSLWTDSIMNRNFSGLEIKFPWSVLEPSYGSYHFSLIDSVINYMKKMNGKYSHANPKRLVIQLPDKFFYSAGYPGPSYMQFGHGFINDTTYKGGYYHEDSLGWVLKTWVPAVNDRWKIIIEKLGKKFNDNSMVEAIVFSETVVQRNGFGAYKAGSYSGTALDNGYDLTAYEQAYENDLGDFVKFFPNTMMIQYTNRFSDGNGTAKNEDSVIQKFGNFLIAHYIGMGGPDVQPPTHIYTLHSDSYGFMTTGVNSPLPSIPIGMSVQQSDYGYYNENVRDLYQFAVGPKDTLTNAIVPKYAGDPDYVNPLNSNYVFWEFTNRSGAPVQFHKTNDVDTTTVIGFVNKEHARINVQKP